jgi:hypothetical protein
MNIYWIISKPLKLATIRRGHSATEVTEMFVEAGYVCRNSSYSKPRKG